MRRPVGVIIIAILAIIGGLLQLFGGLAFLGIGAMAVPGLEGAGLLGGLGIGVGFAMFVMAALSVLFGVGALMLKSWAWMLGVVLYGISVVSGVVLLLTGGIAWPVVLSTLIAAGIIAYLFTPTVRSAFGHDSGTGRTTGGGTTGRHSGGRPVTHA
jgi:hypothetical protein